MLRPGAAGLLPDRRIGGAQIEVAIGAQARLRRAGARVPGGAGDALRPGEIAAEAPGGRAGLFIDEAVGRAEVPVADRAEIVGRGAGAAVPGGAVRAVDIELQAPGARGLAIEPGIGGAEVPVAVGAEGVLRRAGAGVPGGTVGAREIGDARPGAGGPLPDGVVVGVEIEVAVGAESGRRLARAGVPGGAGDALRPGEIAAEGPHRRRRLFVDVAVGRAEVPVADGAAGRAGRAGAAVPGGAVRAVDIDELDPGAGGPLPDRRVVGAEVEVAVGAKRRAGGARARVPDRAVRAREIGDLRPRAGVFLIDQGAVGAEREVAVLAKCRRRRAGDDMPALAGDALRAQGHADRDGLRFHAAGRERARGDGPGAGPRLQRFIGRIGEHARMERRHVGPRHRRARRIAQHDAREVRDLGRGPAIDAGAVLVLAHGEAGGRRRRERRLQIPGAAPARAGGRGLRARHDLDRLADIRRHQPARDRGAVGEPGHDRELVEARAGAHGGAAPVAGDGEPRLQLDREALADLQAAGREGHVEHAWLA